MQLTSGSEAAILNNDYQPTSDNVGSVTGESGICANEGMALKSCRWLIPLKTISTSGFGGHHLELRYSAKVGLC